MVGHRYACLLLREIVRQIARSTFRSGYLVCIEYLYYTALFVVMQQLCVILFLSCIHHMIDIDIASSVSKSSTPNGASTSKRKATLGFNEGLDSRSLMAISPDSRVVLVASQVVVRVRR